MWDLSTRVFGQSFFTYEMLASAANEKDIKMIKLGVKRLEIISRSGNVLKKDYAISAINYNANGWRWEFIEFINGKEKVFSVTGYYEISEKIERLGKPVL